MTLGAMASWGGRRVILDTLYARQCQEYRGIFLRRMEKLAPRHRTARDILQFARSNLLPLQYVLYALKPSQLLILVSWYLT